MRSLALCVRVLLAAALLLPLALVPLRAADAPPAPPEPKAGDSIVSPIDGATMVFVPAGEFLMGSPNGVSITAEQPQRKVYLDAYYIDKTEVTVAAYRKFCEATKRAMPYGPPAWGWVDEHPIANVSWDDATAYAAWAGKALPTEAQWEKAARGGDGRPYPWGFAWDAAKCSNSVGANMSDKPSPVGSFPKGKSPYGCLDMAGNVWEWCADWYGADYYKDGPAKNPTGPDTGKWHVLRGGSWDFTGPDIFRAAYRYVDEPANRISDQGFRCVSRQD
jgi:formylglycine-generating enzyme required for sulfatase activity